MVTTDQECRVVGWSATAQALLGLKAGQALGKHFFETVQAKDTFGNLMCCRGCGLVEMAKRGLPPNTFEMEVAAASGGRVRLFVSVSFASEGRHGGPRRLVFYLRRDLRRQGDRRVIADRRRARNASLGGAVDPNAPNGPWHLSRREREVLHQLVSGASTQDLAERLGVSGATARNHVQHLLHKMGVHSRVEAVALAGRHGAA